MLGANSAAIAMLSVALCSSARAQPVVKMDVRGECPARTAVVSSLTVLLPGLQITDGERSVDIDDEGPAYSVRIGRVVRTFVDADRDCGERARVAAIFANGVLAPPTVELEPEAPPVAPVAVVLPARRRDGPRIVLEAGGVVAGAPRSSPDNGLVAGGGSLRLFVGTRHWGAALGITALSPVTLAFGTTTARVVRVPLDLSARGRLIVRRFTLALDLGVSIVPFLAEGAGLTIDRGGASVDVGVRLAPQVAYALGRRVLAFVGIEASVFPSPQEFHVTSVGVVGTTPHAWVGGTAGIAIELR